MHLFTRPSAATGAGAMTTNATTTTNTDHNSPPTMTFEMTKEPYTNDRALASSKSTSTTTSPPLSSSETTTALSSPPLTSSLHSRNSAPSAQEQSYLRRASLLEIVRLCLAFLVVATGASILGCAGHVIREYNATLMGGEWYLPLWPVNIDVRPAVVEVVVGGMVILGMGGYMLVGVVPSPRSRFSVQNAAFAFVSIVGLIVSMFAVIYDHVTTFTADAGSRDTLMTFTCRLYNQATVFASSGKNVNLGVSTSTILPQGFGGLCIETQVARWMMVALFVLQVLCLVVGISGIAHDKRISSLRKSRYADLQDEKSSFA